MTCHEHGRNLIEVESLTCDDLLSARARWKYFLAALARDQEMLQQVASAPEKLNLLKHRKQAMWRSEQAKLAEKVISGFMRKFLRCETVEKPELAQAKINEYRQYVATQFDGLFFSRIGPFVVPPAPAE